MKYQILPLLACLWVSYGNFERTILVVEQVSKYVLICFIHFDLYNLECSRIKIFSTQIGLQEKLSPKLTTSNYIVLCILTKDCSTETSAFTSETLFSSIQGKRSDIHIFHNETRDDSFTHKINANLLNILALSFLFRYHFFHTQREIG